MLENMRSGSCNAGERYDNWRWRVRQSALSRVATPHPRSLILTIVTKPCACCIIRVLIKERVFYMVSDGVVFVSDGERCDGGVCVCVSQGCCLCCPVLCCGERVCVFLCL